MSAHTHLNDTVGGGCSLCPAELAARRESARKGLMRLHRMQIPRTTEAYHLHHRVRAHLEQASWLGHFSTLPVRLPWGGE